jgi:hypothetical protein
MPLDRNAKYSTMPAVIVGVVRFGALLAFWYLVGYLIAGSHAGLVGLTIALGLAML